MGKKPVVAFIGMVWAGIALTGCCGDCCKNCRNKNSAAPAVASRNSTTPTVGGDPKPATGLANTTPASVPDNPPAPTMNTSTVQPASATVPPSPMPTQSSLASPAADSGAMSANPLPSRMDDGLGSPRPATTEVRRVPPVPVMSKSTLSENTSSSLPGRTVDTSVSGQQLPPVGVSAPPPPIPGSNESLPPIPGSGSALPPLPR